MRGWFALVLSPVQTLSPVDLLGSVVGNFTHLALASSVGPERQKERRGECYREHEGVWDGGGEGSRLLLGVIG